MANVKLYIYTIFALGSLIHIYAQDIARLPRTLIPTHYDMTLQIDPLDSKIRGTAIMTFHLAPGINSTSDIYLNYDRDTIGVDNSVLDTQASCYVPDPNSNKIVLIHCRVNITAPEEHTLTLYFDAKYSTTEYGWVKSTYMDGGEEQIMIQSNFKPIFARRGFPCMDEPDIETTFSITAEYPSEYTVITNTPVAEHNVDFGQAITRFEDTPVIPTYLVTLFMFKFKEDKLQIEDGIDTRIYTRPEVAQATKGVAEAYFGQILDTLGNYTGFPYQNFSDRASYEVAVPNYVDAAGDFGIFVYRETDFLDEGNKTTYWIKQDIITTMAYRLAHEWYGGDIVPEWWSDVWADEAVASYLKYIIPDKIDASLELISQFQVDVTQHALLHDAMPFAQPLSSKEEDISRAWDIQKKMDPISYQKGASILHMINYMLGGAEKFESALQKHFINRRDSDTNGSDLLQDLFSPESEDTKHYYKYLESWVFSSGYPLVTAKITNETGTVGEATLYQKRFLYPMENKPDDDSTWFVPISWTHQTNPHYDVDLGGVYPPGEEMIYFFAAEHWVMFNMQGACFYRVNYDEELWSRIINNLREDSTKINVLHRTRLVDDIFNIARIGDVSYKLAFELAEFLRDETEYYPWRSALNVFSYLLGKMGDKEHESAIKSYVLDLMDHMIEIPNAKLDDTHIEALNKVMVLKWACDMGHSGCIDYATTKFKAFKESQESLDDYNYREIIFCNGIRHSRNLTEDWDFLWNVYDASTSVHEQNDILNAFGCAEDKDTLVSYLGNIVYRSTVIKEQDVLILFKSVFWSSVGLEAAMEFVEGRFGEINSYHHDIELLSKIVYALAENLYTDDHIPWLQRILSDSSLGSYADVRSNALVYASVNNYWVNNFRGDVEDLIPYITTVKPATTPSTEPTTSTTTDADTESTVTSSEYSTSTEETTTPASAEMWVSSSVVLCAFLGLQYFYRFN